MNTFKTAFAGIIVAASGATASIAADMPVTDFSRPVLGRPLIEDARLVCNGFGRCFRVGPYRRLYGPDVFYPARPVYAPPLYQGPAYEVRRAYREPRYEGPDFDYRRSEEYRGHAYRGHAYDAPEENGRRSYGYRHSENERERETWSHDYRRSEEGER